MTRKMALDLLRATYSKWSDHDAPRLGAALAYYTLLSIAPLLILLVVICGLFFDKSTVERSILQQIQQIAGPSSATTLKMVIENAHSTGTGVFATVIALITLLFGASGVFVQLRDSLNLIWDVVPKTSSAWRSMVWQRLVSFGTILGLGALLIASLLLSTVLTAAEKLFTDFVPLHAAIWVEAANFAVSLCFIAFLFALIFKFVPDVRLDLRDVAIGAIATAILFDVGKVLLALYLGTAAVGSAYGAAGSVVAFVVWVYYSAQIFLFGAVFTRLYADSVGSSRHRAGRLPEPKAAAND